MEYILARLYAYRVKFEKTDERSVRVYGNFDGFSVIKEAFKQSGYVEVDGKLIDYEDFEDWLYRIKT